MKRIMLALLSVFVLILSGCGYGREIDRLKEQMESLQGEIEVLKSGSPANQSETPTQDAQPTVPTLYKQHETPYGTLKQYSKGGALQTDALAKKVMSSAVLIDCVEKANQNIHVCFGGTVVLHQGERTLIATSAYHIDEYQEFSVRVSEGDAQQSYPAVLLGFDEQKTVAILVAEYKIGEPAMWGCNEDVSLGQSVLNGSFDQNFEVVLCQGTILSITDEIFSNLYDIGLIRGTTVYAENGCAVGMYLKAGSTRITPIDHVLVLICDILNGNG